MIIVTLGLVSKTFCVRIVFEIIGTQRDDQYFSNIMFSSNQLCVVALPSRDVVTVSSYSLQNSADCMLSDKLLLLKFVANEFMFKHLS